MARITQVKTTTLPRPGLGSISKTRSWKGGGWFCVRYRLDDEALTASIKKFGILMPLVIRREKGGHRVVSGHKRLHAARALKFKQVPVIDAPETMSEKDAFIFALVSNWRQEFQDMDRALAVAKAVREFRFRPDEVRELVLPLLGLPPERLFVENYLEADRLPSPVKDLIHDMRIPFRACSMLARFRPADLDCFAGRIASGMKLTNSQCLQAVEWIADIVKRDGQSLDAILRGSSFREVLGHRHMDPRTRADRFVSELKRKRFPGYSARLEKFEKTGAQVVREIPLRIEPVAGFEEPGIELYARLKTPRDLDRLIEKLAEHRPELNSLFDFTE